MKSKLVLICILFFYLAQARNATDNIVLRVYIESSVENTFVKDDISLFLLKEKFIKSKSIKECDLALGYDGIYYTLTRMPENKVIYKLDISKIKNITVPFKERIKQFANSDGFFISKLDFKNPDYKFEFRLIPVEYDEIFKRINDKLDPNDFKNKTNGFFSVTTGTYVIAEVTNKSENPIYFSILEINARNELYGFIPSPVFGFNAEERRIQPGETVLFENFMFTFAPPYETYLLKGIALSAPINFNSVISEGISPQIQKGSSLEFIKDFSSEMYTFDFYYNIVDANGDMPNDVMVEKFDYEPKPMPEYVKDAPNHNENSDNIQTEEGNTAYQKMSIPEKVTFLEKENEHLKQEINSLKTQLNNLNTTRGSVSPFQNEKKKSENSEGKTYALLIATNEYNKNQTSWNNLKNPIHDAQAIADILKLKYQAEVTLLLNPDFNSALKEILTFKKKLSEKDKLIFFVAGHGYYDNDRSDGFLAFNDCITLEEDFGKSSYMPMSILNRMLDGTESKQVFAIFDVCFGTSFDPLGSDLVLSNYKNEMDVSLDEFIKRKEENISRIFLASGKGEVPDYWNNSLDHSPFAKKLIQTLETEKAFISPGKLYMALQGNATEPYLKRFGKYEEKGDFLLKAVN